MSLVALLVGAFTIAADTPHVRKGKSSLFQLSSRCAKIHSSGTNIPLSFTPESVRSATVVTLCGSPVTTCGTDTIRVKSLDSSAGHELLGDTLQITCEAMPSTRSGARGKVYMDSPRVQCGNWLYGFEALQDHPLRLPIMSAIPQECETYQAGNFFASRVCVTHDHGLFDKCQIHGPVQVCDDAINGSSAADSYRHIVEVDVLNKSNSSVQVNVQACSTDCDSIAYFDVSHWPTANGARRLIGHEPVTAPENEPITDDDTSSLLSVSELSTFFPGMQLILQPVMDEVCKPIFQAVASAFGDMFAETMGDQTREIIQKNTPPYLAQMLGETVTANVTNLLTDSLSFRLTKSLTDSLTLALGPFLATSVSEALLRSLGNRLHRIIRATVPANLRRVLPRLLSKSSSIAFTRILTRSLTHALVPTLTLALSHDSRQSEWCRACFEHSNRDECSKCNYAPSVLYYTNYYSTYYSDYYADYYGDYYQEAVEKFIKLDSSTSGIHEYAHDIKHEIPK